MQHIKLLLQDLLVLQLPTVDSAPEVGAVVEASTTADISSPKDDIPPTTQQVCLITWLCLPEDHHGV